MIFGRLDLSFNIVGIFRKNKVVSVNSLRWYIKVFSYLGREIHGTPALLHSLRIAQKAVRIVVPRGGKTQNPPLLTGEVLNFYEEDKCKCIQDTNF